MSGDNALDAARRLDHWLPDHFPSCPRCGNLCGRLARVCAGCGTRLHEPLDAEASGVVESHYMNAAQAEREALIPPEGKAGC